METKITVTGPGGKEKVYDLENPEEFKKASELVSKGLGYEEGQTKLNTVEAQLQESQATVNRWNQFLEESKDDPVKLLDFLEKQGIKIPTSKKDDQDFLEDKSSEVIQKLETKIADLEKKHSETEKTVFGQMLDQEHSRLESKFNGTNGFPVYDRDAVAKHSIDTGIWDLEKAYRDLNFDKILEMSKNKTADNIEDHQKKIDRVKSKQPDGGGEPQKPPPIFDKRHGGYEAAGQAAVKEAREKGISIVSDEH